MKRVLALFLFASLFSNSALAADNNQLNFYFNPIGLIIGAVGLGLDIKVHPQWTVGPELEFWNSRIHSTGDFTGDYKVQAGGLGARANWFANGTYTDGLYVSPALNFYSVKVTATDVFGNEATAKATGAAARGIVGYGWFWDSFNMMLGGGLTLFLGDSKVEVTDNTGTKQDVNLPVAALAAEFQLGWTF